MPQAIIGDFNWAAVAHQTALTERICHSHPALDVGAATPIETFLGPTRSDGVRQLLRERPSHYLLSPKVCDYRVAPLDNQREKRMLHLDASRKRNFYAG